MKYDTRATLTISLCLLHAQICTARRSVGYRHEALDDLRARDDGPPPELDSSNFTVTSYNTTEEIIPPPPESLGILTQIVPSPGAPTIDIVSQSQVITSYLTDFTWCVNGPLGLIPTATLLGPPYLNQSTMYATTAIGTATCETVYIPTVTTVCATTLTGLASKIPVTDCNQEITFSSECGFTLETPSPTTSNFTALITPAPTLKRMMTYWLAPWQSLTLGETPSDVDIKICTILEGDELECIRYQEVWEVVLTTSTVTTEREVAVSTTVTGPGTLIVENLQAYITDTIVYVDLSTTLLLETEVATETTSRSKKLVTRPFPDLEELEPTSTVFVTRHVKFASTGIPGPTTIVRLTSTTTQTVGTVTRTRPRPRPTLMDFVPEV